MAHKSKALEHIKLGDMIVVSRFNNARVWKQVGKPNGVAIDDAKRGEQVYWSSVAVVTTVKAREPVNAGMLVTLDGRKAR